MYRSWMIAAGVALSCAVASAQYSDPSRAHPVTVPIRHAGSLDWSTKTWSRKPMAPEATNRIIFNNTCPWWQGGGTYVTVEDCEDFYDSGRVPSPNDPNGPAGTTIDNLVTSFDFGYCTPWPTGQVDIRYGFYDNFGGSCINYQVVGKAPHGIEAAYFDFGAASGNPLPGDNSGGGTLSCWIVTINLANSGSFCLQSDGDGTWENSDDVDSFNIVFQNENDVLTYSIGAGPLFGGEILTGTFGACTYNVPCGTDPGYGPCGTGRNTTDGLWINVDKGSPAGGMCPTGAGAGSSCYVFGNGWPASAWASMHGLIESPGGCSGGTPPVHYCGYADPSTTTACGFMSCPSSSGCQATIATSNPANGPTSGASDYDVTFSGSEIGKPAIIFFGLNGTATIPFSSGLLCIKPPLKRTAPGSTGGTAACTGTHSLTINDPATPVNQPSGTTVHYQGWLRDPMGVGTDLSDGIELIFQ